jgi:hypothetical protein
MKYAATACGLAIWLSVSTAYAMPATTNPGYVACRTESQLDEFISFVVAKDQGSMNAYLNNRKCVSMKAGLKVTVTDSPGFLGGKAGFVFRGVKMWTVREALNYN